MGETNFFDFAVHFVLNQEGGYANDPNDPGKETKYGISKRSYPNVDIVSLTEDEAIAIYRSDFWDEKFDNIDNQDLVTLLLSESINEGKKSAIKVLQLALNNLGSSLVVDGIIGEKTIEEIRKYQQQTLVISFIYQQVLKYVNIVHDNPNDIEFFKGWINRVFKVPSMVIQS